MCESADATGDALSVSDEDDLQAQGGPLIGDAASLSGGQSNSRKGLPKLKEVMRRQKQESEDDESPDIDFVYADEDNFASEIAELYSYTEWHEFGLAQKAFEDATIQFGFASSWSGMSEQQRQSFVQLLLNQVEVSSKPDRLMATRALLYIAQGCWIECQSDAECLDRSVENVTMLYKIGIWAVFVELLSLEMENSTAALNACRKLAVNLADSVELRTILNLLYIVTVVMKSHRDEELRNGFVAELNTTLDDDELFSVRLLSMVTRFCSGSAPHFPMKKVLLLLWKVLLTSLGGMDELRRLKAQYRADANLPEVTEDTLTIARIMRAASPPSSASDQEAVANCRKSNRPGIKRSMMAKQNSLDDLGLEQVANDQEDEDDDPSNGENGSSGPIGMGLASASDNFGRDSPRPGSPMPQEVPVTPRNLPWSPKVHQRDLDQFLNYTRKKFVGFVLENDRISVAGLPPPICEGVQILKHHMYKSLSELQIETEEDISQLPLSRPERPVQDTPTEMLYRAMLPSLPQYMIALLKILLAAAPTAKAKTDSINIMTDVLPEEMPMSVMQSMKLSIDVNRHKEIIVKAVSAILLLLLKHFKINHVYQFEFMSQHLVFANCIPLVLKFFNQNLMAYISFKNNIALLDFPSCVIGEQPELTAETLKIGDTMSYCWRNCFSCINLLRVLNKLTKWKHSRIMMMVVFKSAPILKRTLKVKHATMQLYVLKLLKMQTRYLGRQWRKSNMKTMSAIYTKVRHRLNDDWAYGNDVDSRPWDFQGEECQLRTAVDRFNQRRYGRETGASAANNAASAAAAAASLANQAYSALGPERQDSDYEPVDNCIFSVLSQQVDLTDEFKLNYERWLYKEVYNTNIEWELLLDASASGSL